ncbi:MAG: aldehyde dehydrogenase family protein [Terriglobales bacterium]
MATMEAAAEVVRIFAGGEWRTSRSEQFLEICNPANGALLARVPFCLPEEVDHAVAAAAAAFPAWRDTPVTQRVRVLFRYRELLNQREEELAQLTSREHGKTLEEARASVRRGIEVVEFACGIPTLLMGESVEGVGRHIDTVSLRQPLGVCIGIPPFNFPAMVPLWMFPMAVACGNTFVLKPSEKVPLTASRLAALFAEAGLPAGVLNVVHGGAEVVNRLLDHPEVKAVSFVGSSQVAQHVYARAASQGKRVQSLGGAKNHLVVLPDADLELTTEAVIGSAFGCAGERCLAGSVVVAVGAIAGLRNCVVRRRVSRLVTAPCLRPRWVR